MSNNVKNTYFGIYPYSYSDDKRDTKTHLPFFAKSEHIRFSDNYIVNANPTYVKRFTTSSRFPS